MAHRVISGRNCQKPTAKDVTIRMLATVGDQQTAGSPKMHVGGSTNSCKSGFVRQSFYMTITLVGHQSARSENKLTYGLYSAGISDTQKREIIDQIRLPQDVLL
jgi:hypothetical protein